MIKILYVEDEPSAAQVTTRILSKFYNVTYRKNGQEALDTFIEDPTYDIIVTDIQMPLMSGLEFLGKVKELGYNPFSIVTSAHNEFSFLVQAIELRINKFLIKPINANILLEYIREFTSIITTRKELQNQKQRYENLKHIINQHSLISIINENGELIDVNEKFMKVSGYGKDELIGQKCSIVKHPNTPQSYFHSMWDTITKGEIFHLEVQNLTKNGKSYWLRGIVSPIFNNDHTIKEYMSIMEDITNEIEQQQHIEQLKKEKELQYLQKAVKVSEQALVDLIPLPSAIFDGDILAYQNSEFQNLFLLDSTKEKNLFELISTDCIELETKVFDLIGENYLVKLQQLDDGKKLIILTRS
jgi:PAS domain S-box-containing protein